MMQEERNAGLDALRSELERLDSTSFPTLHALAESVKVRTKIDIPQGMYPGVNFVGKLLGPGGQTLRSIQQTTKTRCAILGAGSMRDSNKEKELLASGDPKYLHLKQKLHLQVDTIAPPAEAYYRLSYAIAELRKAMLAPGPNDAAPVSEAWQPEASEFATPPFATSQSSFAPRGAAAGASRPFNRGNFSPRGRVKSWTGRGASNGFSANGSNQNVPGIPAAPEIFPNTNPAAPPMVPAYDKNGFQGANGFEQYASTYGNDGIWGSAPHSDVRGRGRSHPYARPGMKTGQP